VKIHPTIEMALNRIYLIKAANNAGYIYCPKVLIGKKVKLEEVWYCPTCNAQIRLKDKDEHNLKMHKGG
jgi:hypothetical protein